MPITKVGGAKKSGKGKKGGGKKRTPSKKAAPAEEVVIDKDDGDDEIEFEEEAVAEPEDEDDLTPEEPDEDVVPVEDAAPAVAPEPEPEPEPVAAAKKYQVRLVRGARYYFKGIIVERGGVIEVTAADRNHLVRRSKGAFVDHVPDAAPAPEEVDVPDPEADIPVEPEDPNAPVVVTGAETEGDVEAKGGRNRGRAGITDHGRPVSRRARTARKSTDTIGV